MESLNAILPTPPTSPKRVLGQGGQAATLRCSRAALGLLLSTLATHESRFFAELPNHLIEYLDSLPAFRAFQLARSKRGLPPSRAYYLHRYELCAVVAGLKPCLLLGFGNAHSNELAVELDDRWIEQVWEETLLELEKIGREDNERGKLALGTSGHFNVVRYDGMLMSAFVPQNCSKR